MPDICATKKTMKTRGHMDKLLVAAAAAADAGEVPVAAAIVNLDGQIIALAENRMKRDGNAHCIMLKCLPFRRRWRKPANHALMNMICG